MNRAQISLEESFKVAKVREIMVNVMQSVLTGELSRNILNIPYSQP